MTDSVDVEEAVSIVTADPETNELEVVTTDEIENVQVLEASSAVSVV